MKDKYLDSIGERFGGVLLCLLISDNGVLLKSATLYLILMQGYLSLINDHEFMAFLSFLQYSVFILEDPLVQSTCDLLDRLKRVVLKHCDTLDQV